MAISLLNKETLAKPGLSRSQAAMTQGVYLDDYNPMGLSSWSDALDAALAVLGTSGGTIFGRGRTYSISRNHQFPHGVGLLCAGAGKQRPGTRFLCTTSTAGLSFGVTGSGGQAPKSGNFMVDGGGVATLPLYIGRRTQSAFDPVTVINSAGDGVHIEEGQNLHLSVLSVEDCVGSGLVLDRGTGGHLFSILEINNCGSNGSYQLVIQQSAATPTLYAAPSDILAIQAIVERPASGCAGNIWQRGGSDVSFDHLVSANVTGLTPFAHVKLSTDDGSQARFRVRSSYFTDQTTGGTVFDVGSGCSLYLEGRSQINGCKYLFKLSSTSVVGDQGLLVANIGTELDPASTGTLDAVVRYRHRYAQQVSRRITSDLAFSALLDGDAFPRWVLLGNGQMQWQDPATGNGLGQVNGSASARFANVSVGFNGDFSGGVRVFAMQEVVTEPNADPSSGHVLWTKSGLLKARTTGGSIESVVPLTRFVRKSADTVKNANTTLADDPHLTVAVPANATFVVELHLLYDGSTAADIKVHWTGPALSTFDWTPNALSGAATTATSSVLLSGNVFADTPAFGSLGVGVKAVAKISGILVVGNTAGNLTLQWAQNISDATDLTVRAGSALNLRRVA